LGVLWCRQELLESLPFAKLQPAPDTAPECAETGTQNHEGIAGVAAAVNFLASLGEGGTCRQRLGAAYAGIHKRAAEQTRQMWAGLSAIDGVSLFGPPPDAPRTPTVAFTVRDIPSSQVAKRLSEQALFVSHGDFYAATVVERLGLDAEGLVRAGCACYTKPEEVDRLVAVVQSLSV
jgi:selenocysteine lyase/cysteine desulfurase